MIWKQINKHNFYLYNLNTLVSFLFFFFFAIFSIFTFFSEWNPPLYFLLLLSSSCSSLSLSPKYMESSDICFNCVSFTPEHFVGRRGYTKQLASKQSHQIGTRHTLRHAQNLKFNCVTPKVTLSSFVTEMSPNKTSYLEKVRSVVWPELSMTVQIMFSGLVSARSNWSLQNKLEIFATLDQRN